MKGIERFLGTLETQSQELMETSSGIAKYEHQHKAIVWRVPRLPKQGQGSYTNHEFVCKLQLTSYDQMPENFDKVRHHKAISNHHHHIVPFQRLECEKMQLESETAMRTVM